LDNGESLSHLVKQKKLPDIRNKNLCSNNISKNIKISILMPCLNEAETLATCIEKAKLFLQKNHILGEIIIADNGSEDGSQDIALKHGGRVIHVPERGYGSALIVGINACIGEYIIMGDADDSYDFKNLMPFIEKLEEGYELVMGNRFQGGIKKGAMPPLHKYLGNPILSGIGKLFFKSPISDFHCGLRGFRKDSILRLDLQTSGMEFASEMVVKATLNNLKITEVPTTLSPDGRSRSPHLKSWKDGWRNLRFLLLYSPRWLFFYPGTILFSVGLLIMVLLSTGPITFSGVVFDIHTMLYSAMSMLLGFTIISFGLFAKVFTINNRLIPENDNMKNFYNLISLESGIVVGFIVFIIGIVGSMISILIWESKSFGSLIPTSMMRIVIPSATFLVLGIQIIFASFFLSILGLKIKKVNSADPIMEQCRNNHQSNSTVSNQNNIYNEF